MRQLMLLRHAKTESDSPSGRDIDRRLEPRGLQDAALIGGWLAANRLIPDQVLVSAAARTRETWAVLARQMPRARVDMLGGLYGAEPSEVLEAIRLTGVPDARALMVIGHNPGLHELALLLTGTGDPAAHAALADNFPTSALAILDFTIEDWTDVSFGLGRLTRFVTPKMLKAAA